MQNREEKMHVYVNNENGTKWNLVSCAITQVIKKIERQRSRSPICLISGMITN